MASLDIGKPESVKWVKDHFPKGAVCLDVGACDGKWAKLLNDYLVMDCVEIYRQNIIKHGLMNYYRKVYHEDIRNFSYTGRFYDLIIFGDVLEHMSVEDAQKVLANAWVCCNNFLIAVPFEWKNRSHYGNPYEVHIQDDLTPQNVLERYKGIQPLFIYERYGYYIKGGRNVELC